MGKSKSKSKSKSKDGGGEKAAEAPSDDITREYEDLQARLAEERKHHGWWRKHFNDAPLLDFVARLRARHARDVDDMLHHARASELPEKRSVIIALEEILDEFEGMASDDAVLRAKDRVRALEEKYPLLLGGAAEKKKTTEGTESTEGKLEGDSNAESAEVAERRSGRGGGELAAAARVIRVPGLESVPTYGMISGGIEVAQNVATGGWAWHAGAEEWLGEEQRRLESGFFKGPGHERETFVEAVNDALGALIDLLGRLCAGDVTESKNAFERAILQVEIFKADLDAPDADGVPEKRFNDAGVADDKACDEIQIPYVPSKADRKRISALVRVARIEPGRWAYGYQADGPTFGASCGVSREGPDHDFGVTRNDAAVRGMEQVLRSFRGALGSGGGAMSDKRKKDLQAVIDATEAEIARRTGGEITKA